MVVSRMPSGLIESAMTVAEIVKLDEPLPDDVAQAIAILLWNLHETEQRKTVFQFPKFQVSGVLFENVEVTVERSAAHTRN
jgi:hypothetical protein